MKHALVIAVSAFAVFLTLSPPSHAQWVQTNNSFPGSVTAITVNGANLFAGTSGSGSGGAYLSTDNGGTWSAPYSDLGDPYIRSFAYNSAYLFAATDVGVDRMAVNGSTWKFVSSGIVNRSITGLAVGDTNLFAGTLGGVYLSTNNGSNWTNVSSGMKDTTVVSLAVSGTNLFAGTQGGHVYLSTNSGGIWSEADSGITSLFVQALATIGTNVFAGTSGGVYVSTNNGGHWTAATNGLTKAVNALLVSGTNLFAGAQNNGVYLSTNNGANWTAVNTGLGKTVYALASNGTYLFAGVGGGAWRRPLAEMTTSIEPSPAQLPGAFVLCQNYPNPFNPTTTIRFELPQSSHVVLTVYDALGRRVSTLACGMQEAGYHEVVFDGSNLASGVYFYRLEAGSFVQTKTLIILR